MQIPDHHVLNIYRLLFSSNTQIELGIVSPIFFLSSWNLTPVLFVPMLISYPIVEPSNYVRSCGWDSVGIIQSYYTSILSQPLFGILQFIQYAVERFPSMLTCWLWTRVWWICSICKSTSLSLSLSLHPPSHHPINSLDHQAGKSETLGNRILHNPTRPVRKSWPVSLAINNRNHGGFIGHGPASSRYVSQLEALTPITHPTTMYPSYYFPHFMRSFRSSC